MFAYELRERLIVCRSLIAHLKNRKETRWHSFNENLDYPETDEKFYKYVNSKLENGEIRMIFRDIVVCPGTLIVMEDKKAVMKYPKNCWGCVSCVKECKAGAIDFFLGADIGGNGSIMNVKSEGDILHWIITKTDGSTSVIDVDRRNSNKY